MSIIISRKLLNAICGDKANAEDIKTTINKIFSVLFIGLLTENNFPSKAIIKNHKIIKICIQGRKLIAGYMLWGLRYSSKKYKSSSQNDNF